MRLTHNNIIENKSSTFKNILAKYWHVLYNYKKIAKFIDSYPSCSFKRGLSNKDQVTNFHFVGDVCEDDPCTRLT